jgi:hypothetical protein
MLRVLFGLCVLTRDPGLHILSIMSKGTGAFATGASIESLIDLDIFDTVLISYAQLSRRPLLFRSFTGLEITEFHIISKEIESKYYEHKNNMRTIMTLL